MNEINNFNPIAFRSYSAPTQQGNVTNPITTPQVNTEKAQDFYIDQKGVDALKANIVMSNPLDITKPISADDYATKLQKSGLEKGKDFEIMNHQDGGRSVYVIDKNGNPIKSAIWSGGVSADNYDGCTNISYPENDGIASVATTYNKNNAMDMREVRYKDVENHKDLFPENIDMNTTAEDYVKILQKQNINYEMEKQEEQGNKNVFIVETDKNGNMNKMTSFNDFADGSRMIGQSNTPDKNGNLVHDVSLVSDGPYSELIVTDAFRS